MKTTLVAKENQVLGANSTVMSIDEASVGILMHNLTNLYSQPAIAVFREYTANALDSHIKAGKLDTPIKVTTPTFQGDYLTIQDFGVGLSREEIENVYSKYGSSTKRDSNSQIGAFGLGAKSALAISNTFLIISVKDGVRVECDITKNASGVGVITINNELETDEPNGVTIKVPVSNYSHINDIKNFAGSFFSTWKPNTAYLNGSLNEKTIFNDATLSVANASGEFAWIYAGPNYRRGWSSATSATLIIGGIAYKFEAPYSHDKLGGKNESIQKIKSMMQGVNGELYLEAPIGSIDLTPSREEVMLTERTIATIQNLFEEFVTFAPITISHQLNKLERKDVVPFVLEYNSFLSVRDSLGVPADIFWQGEIVPREVMVDDAYSFTTFSGTAPRKPQLVENLPIIFAAQNGETRLIVKMSQLTPELVLKASRYVRDYLDALGRQRNAKVFFVKESFSNVWAALRYEFITVDELIIKAKEQRKAKKSGVVATKSEIKFPVYTVNSQGTDRTVNKLSEDELPATIFWASTSSEEGNIKNTLVTDDRWLNGAYGHATLTSQAKAQLESVFPDGSNIVFLSSTRSVARFMKAVPNAVSLKEAAFKKIVEILGENPYRTAILALGINRYHTFKPSVALNLGNLIENVAQLDEASINLVSNKVVRGLAIALKEANTAHNSNLVSLIENFKFTQDEVQEIKSLLEASLEVASGINIVDDLPLLNSISIGTNYNNPKFVSAYLKLLNDNL